MIAKFIIVSALELLAVGLLIWLYLRREKKLIAVEDRIARRAAKLAVAVGAAARRYLKRTEVTPMAQYRSCPDCGAKNDPNEICDCTKRAAISKAIAAAPDDAHSVTVTIMPPNTERQERRTHESY